MPPILFVSEPGRGKTAAIRAFAQRHGRCFVNIIPSTKEPSDVGGLPDVRERNGRRVSDTAMPAWVSELWDAYEKGLPGLVCVDELTTCRASVQATLLGVFAERRTDSWELPPNVWLLSAANPPECAAGGTSLEPPMANRLVWRQWGEVPLEEWLAAGPKRFRVPVTHPILDAPETPAILSGDDAVSDAALGRAWALIGAYLRAKPSMRHRMPAEESRRSGPWPSERSWHMAAVCIAACLDAGRPLEVAAEWVGGCVGDSVALEWLAMAKSMALPSIADILSGAIRWSAANAARDVAYAVAAELASAIEREPLPERATRAIEAIIDGPRDVIAPFVGRIGRAARANGWNPPKAVQPKISKLLELVG